MISEKKEFIAVDYMKLFCALLIVGLHTSVFAGVSEQAAFIFDEIVSRIGVPFFFLASGFFVAGKLGDGAKLMQYIKRLLLLYLIYSVMYLPQMILVWKREGRAFAESVCIFLRQFFFVGSYCQLWYFAGLVVAVLLLYLLVKVLKFDIVTNFSIAILLYIAGVLGSAYKSWYVSLPLVGDVLMAYYKIFDTTRNGVFFGLLFVLTGYYLKIHSDKLKPGKKYLFFALLFFGVLVVEAYSAKLFAAGVGLDMTFSLFPLGVFLFLGICSVKVPDKYLATGVTVRNISTLMFGFHLFVDFYAREILSVRLGIMLNSVTRYVLTVVINLILAVLILWLSKYKYFKWLKLLY